MQSVEYTSDAVGRRIARSVDADGVGSEVAEKEFFVYNGDNVWADYISMEESIRYYLFANQIDSNMSVSGEVDGSVFYLRDRIGSIRDLLALDGELTDHIEFTSFGRLFTETNTLNLGRYGYASREFDSQLNVYYYRARVFSGLQGRFLSFDPIGYGSSDFNLYRYLFNSPGRGTDPTGLSLVETTFIEGQATGRNAGAAAATGTNVGAITVEAALAESLGILQAASPGSAAYQIALAYTRGVYSGFIRSFSSNAALQSAASRSLQELIRQDFGKNVLATILRGF